MVRSVAILVLLARVSVMSAAPRLAPWRRTVRLAPLDAASSSANARVRVAATAAAGARDPSRPRTALLLTAATGGGHKSATDALVKSLEAEGVRCRVVDVIGQYTRWPMGKGTGASYAMMQRNPWLYRIYYAVTQPRLVHRPLLKTVFREQKFRREQLGEGGDGEAAPDVIVSLHGYAQPGLVAAVAGAAKKAKAERVPVVCVLQDLATADASWFHPKASVRNCFEPLLGSILSPRSDARARFWFLVSAPSARPPTYIFNSSGGRVCRSPRCGRAFRDQEGRQARPHRRAWHAAARPPAARANGRGRVRTARRER